VAELKASTIVQEIINSEFESLVQRISKIYRMKSLTIGELLTSISSLVSDPEVQMDALAVIGRVIDITGAVPVHST